MVGKGFSYNGRHGMAIFSYRNNNCLWWQATSREIYIYRLEQNGNMESFLINTQYIDNYSGKWIILPAPPYSSCDVYAWFPLENSKYEGSTYVTGMLGWCGTNHNMFLYMVKWNFNNGDLGTMQYTETISRELGSYSLLSKPVQNGNSVYFITQDSSIVRVEFTTIGLQTSTDATVTKSIRLENKISSFWLSGSYIITQAVQ